MRNLKESNNIFRCCLHALTPTRDSEFLLRPFVDERWPMHGSAFEG